ncbi:MULTISPECIES: TIM barrel protein [unclassified Rhizobium]|uniref:sugar phosphate isomerase/epimerase family protein n=1 Tax=unclassified Rhizobium TaxID=2613769 RepID=UPI001AE90E6E|nr:MULTISPECIES: TIM barrel protein [unclassified Rhizobium]MBP2459274.1 sugar phosphate isomerase/epimerase [Rhizobium sp. PvP014]MBP2531569.1 sugar phosphate isomerase/epimerase [Rhizobium sp. PvP099]
MKKTWSLSFLTGLGVAPEEAVRAAADAGYDYLGLRLMPAFPGGLAYPLMDDPARVKSLISLMGDSGVAVFDIEMIRISPDFDPEPLLPFLECAGQLGARAILVAGDDADEGRLTTSFVKLCEAARPFGLSMDLEFMPQSELRDLSAAIRVLSAADQPNQGVIIDTLHVSRARTTIEEITAVPRKWLNYAQICDAPAKIPETREELNYTARHARLLPGEGELDLAGMFAAMPADLPVAVEIPNDEQSAGLSAAEWAKRTLIASRRILEPESDEGQ